MINVLNKNKVYKLLFIIGIIITIIIIYINHSEFFVTTTITPKKIDYYILTREVTDKLYSVYKQLIPNVKFISDTKNKNIDKDNVFFYSDEIIHKNNFYSMHSSIKFTSWDKIIYNLYLNNDKDYYWIIEDDVFLKDKDILNKFDDNSSDLILMNGWNKKYPDNWARWNKNPKFKYFDRDETYSSLNTIIRCSNRLINKIMEFKNNHNKLIFHEILLYSLAKQNNFSVLNYKSKDVFNSAYDIRKKKSIKEIYDEALNLYLIKHPIKGWWKYA